MPDPGYDEIPELLRLPIEGTDVPAQAVVDQRERDDLPLGAATGGGVVLDAERTLLVNRPSHTRKDVQNRVGEPGRTLAGNPRLEPHRLAVTKSLGQPRQHPLRREVEDRLKVLPQDVGLRLGVVIDVAGGQFFVQRQIPRCGGRLDAKPRD
ncbi:hypothetical protein D9M68_718560 [compost metagenome]